MLGVELGGDALDLNEGHELLIDADAVVGELAANDVLGGEVRIFIVSETIAQEVGDEQPRVALVRIASNQVGETDAEVKDYVEGSGFPYPVLLDREQLACNILGGKRTPHVFLLDAKNTLRYSGSIDDDPSAEKEATARAHWLEDAIKSVAESREVNVLMTSPKG